LTSTLYCYNTDISGNVSGFPSGLALSLYCYSTDVSGAFTAAQAICGEIQCYSTLMTQTDIEQSLINLESAGTSGNTFRCDTGMPTITDTVAIAAVASLRGRDWTITLAGGI